jgi:Transposase DDE domain
MASILARTQSSSSLILSPTFDYTPLWVSDEVLAAWRNTPRRGGQRGHPQDYTDTAILTMAALQEVYHLPSR